MKEAPTEPRYDVRKARKAEEQLVGRKPHSRDYSHAPNMLIMKDLIYWAAEDSDVR